MCLQLKIDHSGIFWGKAMAYDAEKFWDKE